MVSHGSGLSAPSKYRMRFPIGFSRGQNCRAAAWSIIATNCVVCCIRVAQTSPSHYRDFHYSKVLRRHHCFVGQGKVVGMARWPALDFEAVVLDVSFQGEIGTQCRLFYSGQCRNAIDDPAIHGDICPPGVRIKWGSRNDCRSQYAIRAEARIGVDQPPQTFQE